MKRNTKKLELQATAISGKQNWHYEVISKSIFDNNKLDEYYTLKHAKKCGANIEDLVIREDQIPENTLLVYRYIRDKDDNTNIFNAKRSNLGVLRFLKGKLQGKEFMFSLFDDTIDIAGQLLIYGYLTYEYKDEALIKKIKNDKTRDIFLQFVAGDALYNQIIEN